MNAAGTLGCGVVEVVVGQGWDVGCLDLGGLVQVAAVLEWVPVLGVVLVVAPVGCATVCLD